MSIRLASLGETRPIDRSTDSLFAVNVSNIGRAIPSFGILVLAYIVVSNISGSLAFGFVPTVVALVLLTIPPILTNTYVGIQSVDPDTVESARGMGMNERQVLFRLEVPVAAPLIMAGLRTSAVTVVVISALAVCTRCSDAFTSTDSVAAPISSLIGGRAASLAGSIFTVWTVSFRNPGASTVTS